MAALIPFPQMQAPQAPAPEPEPPPDLAKLKRLFDEARNGLADNRRLSECWRDYYDGKQLTEAQRQVLRLRKQPDVVINRTRRAIDGTLGVIQQSKTDPRAYMRNPQGNNSQPQRQAMGAGAPMMPGVVRPMFPGQAMAPPGVPQMQPPVQPDLDASDVASMTLRYVADRSNFQNIKIDVLEAMCIEGTAGAITEFIDGEITITLIAADEYFWDPHSKTCDLSDKHYDGIAKWRYGDDVALDYPDAAADIETAISVGDAGSNADLGWADKPDQMPSAWVDTKRRRLMVVEMYYKEDGVWNHCVFHAGGILRYGKSAYLDEKGRPRNPIEAQSMYIGRDLTRYGLVRDMLDIQDEINARRSKALHEINTRQIQNSDPNAPPIDVDVARQEAAKPDGVLPAGWQVVPRSDVVANSLALLQEAKVEMERMAPNPAILGRQGADASGRAQQLRAQAGLVELARPLGRFTDWEHRVYVKQIWPCARQFYTDPMWIRVTDDIGAPQYVQINEPAPPDPYTGMPSGPPKNHIAMMDVDIVVDNVPDTATLEQEIWADLVQLAQTYGPQAVPFDVMVEMSPLPNKQRIIKRLKQAQSEAAQAAQPAMQMKAAETQAGIDKTKSETVKNLSDAKAKEISATRDALEGHAHALSLGAMGGAQPGPMPTQPPQPLV